jgi:hypothetical protein
MVISCKVPAKRNSLAITWDGYDYPRIPPGIYSAVGECAQGPQWVRCYRRWSLRIAFSILGEDGDVAVSAFFNLGKNPDNPSILRTGSLPWYLPPLSRLSFRPTRTVVSYKRLFDQPNRRANQARRKVTSIRKVEGSAQTARPTNPVTRNTLSGSDS